MSVLRNAAFPSYHLVLLFCFVEVYVILSISTLISVYMYALFFFFGDIDVTFLFSSYRVEMKKTS